MSEASKRLKLAIWFFVMAVTLTSTPTQAAMMFRIQDGLNPALDIADNGLGDLDPTLGSISVDKASIESAGGSLPNWTITNIWVIRDYQSSGIFFDLEMHGQVVNSTTEKGVSSLFAAAWDQFDATGAGDLILDFGGTVDQGFGNSIVAQADKRLTLDGVPEVWLALGPYGPGAFSVEGVEAHGPIASHLLLQAVYIQHGGTQSFTTWGQGVTNTGPSVPEPSSILLLGCAGAALVLFAARSRNTCAKYVKARHVQ